MLAAPAAAQEQPRVLAAWSQAFGATDPRMTGLIAPRVEMRFVLDAGGDCEAFGIERRLGAGDAWRAAPGARSRAGGAAGPLAVEVCAAPMTGPDGDWFAARLRWGGAEAALTSELVRGDDEESVGEGFAPGAADGAAVELWGGASIGARRADGELVVASLGDTGCRGVPRAATKPDPTPADLARLERARQTCDPAAWPLAELAVAAAAAAPDLVLHVGDYRYFLEDQVSEAESGWLYWQKDFFPAMQPLLLAGPLVAARGNHEACGAWGFGAGYFQLFGDGSATSCAGAPDPMPPEVFDVGVGGIEAGVGAHRFVVVDTNDDAAAGLTDRYRTAMAMTRAPGAPSSAWWVTHIPAITLVDYDGVEHTGDPELQADLVAAPPAGGLEDWFCGGAEGCRPSQILLGHQHLFQSLEFPEGGVPGGRWLLPRHVVVGHGGTRIDDASPAPQGAVRCRYDGFDALAMAGAAAPVGIAETRMRHGVAIWRRSAATLDLPAGWALQPLWAGPAPLAAVEAQPPACDG